jgi:hypothetical protein
MALRPSPGHQPLPTPRDRLSLQNTIGFMPGVEQEPVFRTNRIKLRESGLGENRSRPFLVKVQGSPSVPVRVRTQAKECSVETLWPVSIASPNRLYPGILRDKSPDRN